MSKKPVVLIIMDGFGNNPSDYGNAIKSANTPNLDRIFSSNPLTYIGASGMDVGLPDGQMGNSEVGHTNIGAGRVVYQELTRISKSIKDGDFFENEGLLKAVNSAKTSGKALHFIGLLSDGGVHSHNEHLYGLLELAKRNNLEKVYVHALMDGRDVSPTSGEGFIAELQAKIDEIGVGKIATITGRYYAMDRDNRWERVELAYNAIVKAEGKNSSNVLEVLPNSYAENVTDEFIIPTVINGGAKIEENDSVVFFNFRPDRAREITRTIVDPDFNGFSREFFPTTYVCMTQYDVTMPNVAVAFKPQALTNTFGEYVSEKGLTQLRIAETEKYAHVTFFFNGGVEQSFEGEDRALINSPKVATYDLQPEMSALLVRDEVVSRINSGKYDTIILNYANCDMVGHTAILDAVVKAVETVDECVNDTVNAVLAMGGIALITADHGNADKILDENGKPFTAHTTFPVPFCVVGAGDVKLREGGILADIAPTMLKLMGLEKPESMEGTSIIL